MNHPESVWIDCLRILSTKINPVSYRAWFEKTKQLSLKDSELIILTETQFIADWLAQNYASIITKTAETVTGKTLNISIAYHINEHKQFEIISLNNEPIEDKPFDENTTLNPRYNFESFVVGDFNCLAYTAAMAIAEAPGKTRYNPLYVYGGVGLGKTHLLQAIGNFIRVNKPEKVVRYISSERFTDRFVKSLMNKSTGKFKEYFRRSDILLVDDVQFFTGKETIQNEFFHIFNALHQRGQQIVLTSDVPPSQIKGLEKRLCSRFEWGLLVDLQTPEYESRVAILRQKAESDDFEIPDDVLSYIAQNVTSNIRELEGSLIRLLAYSSIQGREISLDLAIDIIQRNVPDFQSKIRDINLNDIMNIVSQHIGISPELIRSRKRTKQIAVARQIGMYLARKFTNFSLSHIGKFFGDRDHATVVHACKVIPTKSGEVARLIEKIESSLFHLE